MLERTFLFEPLPAWSANLGKRLTRFPKVVLVDSGLAGHLVGADPERRAIDPRWGALAETFVVGELRAQAGWSEVDVTLSHFRAGRNEVDIVLEDRSGRVVGIEVELGATIGRDDTRGLGWEVVMEPPVNAVLPIAESRWREVREAHLGTQSSFPLQWPQALPPTVRSSRPGGPAEGGGSRA